MKLWKRIIQNTFPTGKYEWKEVDRVPNWANRALKNKWSGQGSPIQIIKVRGKTFDYKLKSNYKNFNNEKFTYYKRLRKKSKN